MNKKLLFVALAIIPIFALIYAAGGNFGGGTGILTDPYLIEDVLDLQAMNEYLTAHYALANDIDASATSTWNSGTGFLPIGQWVADGDEPFSGSLDGRNYTILNLYINRPLESYIGLFGWALTDHFIKAINLTGADINGDTCVGVLIGMNENGTIENVSVSGSVFCENINGAYAGGIVGLNYGDVTLCSAAVTAGGCYYVGGLLGYHDGASVSDSFSYTAINGSYYLGGLIGYISSGTVTDSYSQGTVTGTYDEIGGFVGTNDGTIFGCRTSTDAEGRSYIGGFSGNNYGTITNCYSTGFANADLEFSGGFTGYINGGLISSCYSIGNASGADYTGGFSGITRGTIENCYSKGSVTRISGSVGTYTGGFTGLNHRSGLINCYSTGSVHYENDTDPIDKGFAGGVNTGGSYNMQGNFWDIDTSGQTSSAGIATGMTTADMKTGSKYTDAGWDFVGESINGTLDIWNINGTDNFGYPFLSWQNFGLGAPEGLTIVYSSTEPELTWSAVSGAKSYKVYSSADPYAAFPSAWTLKTEVMSGTNWTDEDATEIKKFYIVVAVN
jgi:hypothetical protein